MLGLVGTMLVLFGLVVWFWLQFVLLGGLFGRPDISGQAKARWTAVLILLPFLGVFAYLVVRGMGERSEEAH